MDTSFNSYNELSSNVPETNLTSKSSLEILLHSVLPHLIFILTSSVSLYGNTLYAYVSNLDTSFNVAFPEVLLVLNLVIYLTIVPLETDPLPLVVNLVVSFSS